MEIWKDIKDYEGLYQVSNLGNVKALSRKHTETRRKTFHELKLKAVSNNGGYLSVKLCNKVSVKRFSIHRLVAAAFCDNSENNPHVDHIDHDRKNNNANNLRWVSNIENQRHSAHKRLGLQNKTAKTVLHKDYGIFCTITEAAKIHGCSQQHMSAMISGKFNNTSKFIHA